MSFTLVTSFYSCTVITNPSVYMNGGNKDRKSARGELVGVCFKTPAMTLTVERYGATAFGGWKSI